MLPRGTCEVIGLAENPCRDRVSGGSGTRPLEVANDGFCNAGCVGRTGVVDDNDSNRVVLCGEDGHGRVTARTWPTVEGTVIETDERRVVERRASRAGYAARGGGDGFFQPL